MTTPTDTAAHLRELAAKATPGPWVIEPVKRQHRNGTGRDNALNIVSDGPTWSTWVAEIPGGACNDYARDNAQYMSAANPAAILAILDRLDAAENLMRNALPATLDRLAALEKVAEAATALQWFLCPTDIPTDFLARWRALDAALDNLNRKESP